MECSGGRKGRASARCVRGSRNTGCSLHPTPLARLWTRGGDMDIGHAVKCVALGMPVLLTGGKPKCRAGDERLALFRDGLAGAGELTVQSDVFQQDGPISKKY